MQPDPGGRLRAAVSLLSAASLDLLQPDSLPFLLATLRFEALVEATSALAFTETVLAGTSGAELEVGTALGTELQSLTVIPEPGSAWLVALGLAGLARRRAAQPAPSKGWRQRRPGKRA